MATKKTVEQDPSIAPEGRIRISRQSPLIAARIDNRLIGSPSALPQRVDDAEKMYGLSLYDEMLDTSPALSIAHRYLRDRTFEQGIVLLPPIEAPIEGDEDSDPEAVRNYERALMIAAHCQRNLEHLEEIGEPFEDECERLFSAVEHGRSLAEVTYGRLPDKSIGITRFRYIPRQNYGLVYNWDGAFLGCIGAMPNKGFPIMSGIIAKPEEWANFVPADRLCLVVLNPSKAHRAGQSLLRSAYRDWQSARDVEPVEYASMCQFAGQSIVLVAGESGSQEMTINGVKKSQIEHVSDSLENYQAGSSLVLPHGFTKLDVGGTGNGELFKSFFDRKDRRMVMTLIYSASALHEAERNSQAQAGQSENVTDIAVAALQRKFARVLRRPFMRLVRLQFGDEAVQLTPVVALTSVAKPDFPAMLSAMATAMSSGVITEAMLPRLWRRWLGEHYQKGDDDATEKPDGPGIGDDEADGSAAD